MLDMIRQVKCKCELECESSWTSFLVIYRPGFQADSQPKLDVRCRCWTWPNQQLGGAQGPVPSSAMRLLWTPISGFDSLRHSARAQHSAITQTANTLNDPPLPFDTPFSQLDTPLLSHFVLGPAWLLSLLVLIPLLRTLKCHTTCCCCL